MEARKELSNFWRGEGAYNGMDMVTGTGEAVKRFLDRNIIIPKPSSDGLVVTEERIPYTEGGLQQLINGKYFSANGDVEYWKESNPRRWQHVYNLADEAIKAEAVLAFLEEKEEKRKSADAARDERRDELAAELAPRLGGAANWYGNVSQGLRNAIDRIIEMEAAK